MNLIDWRQQIHRIYTKLYVDFRSPFKTIKNIKRDAMFNLYHITFPSVSNAGDTALSTTVRDIFNGTLGKVSWKLRKASKKVSEAAIRDINKTDAVIIGGHGMFLPDTNANSISNWVFACSENQYDEIKVPIVVFAVGYNFFPGQVRSKLFESNIRKLVERSAFFGLRNGGSVREIQSFLDDELKERVVYQPCPTMVARYLYPDLPAKVKTNKIAFNVALDRANMRMGDMVDTILDQIARAMSEIAHKGYEIHFITHLCVEIPFLKYIKKYSFRFRFHDASTWDAERLMRFYNNMDVVLGMRGHGIWIPFGVNCQIISLGNQNKTKWFLEDINALDWYIDITDEPERLSERIVERFTEIHEVNGEDTNRRLHEAQDRLWEITRRNMDTIYRIIKREGLELCQN